MFTLSIPTVERVSRTAALRTCALPVLLVLVAAARADFNLTGDYVELPVDTSVEPGQFMTSQGGLFNPAGTGGNLGSDFWIWGTPIYNYSQAIAASGTVVNGGGWVVPPVIADTSAGTTNSATITGMPLPDLLYSRVVSFPDSAKFVTITDTVTNVGGATLADVATLDNTDPDQDIPFTALFDTLNDVVTVFVADDLVLATGPDTGLTMGFGSGSPYAILDASGFSNTDPYTILGADPNGALADIGINIALRFGDLLPGESKSATWAIVFGTSKEDAINVYSGVPEPTGVVLLGLGAAMLVGYRVQRKRKNTADRCRRVSIAMTLVATWAFMTPTTRAAELIVNGGFEAGFAGWTVTDQAGGSGSWYVDDGDGVTPFSGSATVGPAAGLLYGVSDQTGPGAHALAQAFVVPAGSTSVILTFDMFVNDWSDAGPIVNPAGLDYTAFPNQHARVDIMSAGAGALDTGAGVLANLYIGVDPGADPNAYTPYAFDITGIVGAGGVFEVRFAEVDNQSFLNQGVDNVSIEAVPEPATLALFGIGILGFAMWGWRRKS